MIVLFECLSCELLFVNIHLLGQYKIKCRFKCDFLPLSFIEQTSDSNKNILESI